VRAAENGIGAISGQQEIRLPVRHAEVRCPLRRDSQKGHFLQIGQKLGVGPGLTSRHAA